MYSSKINSLLLLFYYGESIETSNENYIKWGYLYIKEATVRQVYRVLLSLSVNTKLKRKWRTNSWKTATYSVFSCWLSLL